MSAGLVAVICLWVAVRLLAAFLDYLNLRHARAFAQSVPRDFEEVVDRPLMAKTVAYLAETTRFHTLVSTLSGIVVVLFLFAGPLHAYDSLIASAGLPFAVSGWLFFIVLYLAWELFSIPFSLYYVFHIENRYGFNTMTHRVWLLDFLKGAALSLLLLSAVVLGWLFLVQASGRLWWLFVWCFWLALSVFVTYVSPYVIEPLFNKFTAVPDGPLKDRIIGLARKAGVNVSKVLAMDASKRSTHTNAYFSGIGRTKRVILFDTLLASMGADEIASVLAHEIGHWKKRHILKGLAVSGFVSLVFLVCFYEVVSRDVLRAFLGMPQVTFYGQAAIVGFVAAQLSFLFKPAMNGFTRRLEAEADRFSCDLEGNGEAMVGALVKLSRDNLSNLYPHPLYALFHYSHPPVLRRIERIRDYCR